MSEQNLFQITRISKSEYYASIGKLKKRLDKEIAAPQLSPEKLTKKLSENVITPPHAPIPDCQKCGACCIYALSVPVSNSDLTPPESYWEIMLEDAASEIVAGKMLKRTDTKCDFLNGEISENLACRIYEVRPASCRMFEAGSDRCHAYRRLFGIEPPLTESELSIAVEKSRENAFDEKITFVLITEKEVTARTVITSEGAFNERKTSLLQINVFLGDDETPHILRQFDPGDETWLEDDFLAMTLEEAGKLIALRLQT